MRGVVQGGYHHLDVWGHSIETLRCFERLCRNRIRKDKKLSAYFNDIVGQNRSRLQVVKLACLLHDVGKPAAKKHKNKKTIFHAHEDIDARYAPRYQVVCV